MQIKRYVAPTMREAIAQVREEQGPDAVILSNRRIEEGMEVIAAVDYDEALISRAIKQMTPRAPAAAAPVVEASELEQPAVKLTLSSRLRAALPTQKAAPVQAAKPAPAPAEESIKTLQDPAFTRMREEFQTMRQMLETQLSGLAWGELGRRDPLKAKALRDLAALDIQPDVAQAIIKELPDISTLRDSWKAPLTVLTRKIPIAKTDPLDTGGVIAVVGPTGVGKTTTIAKLAARFALKHGARNVALVSTDTYRIGAREQLHTYARILNVPMHVVQDQEDLSHVLDAVAGRKLVLIDTAGMSQRDLRLAEQFATLQHNSTRIETVLALSAANDVSCLDETVRLFSKLRKTPLMGCVLTKIDEAASLGAPLSVLIRHGLPLLHLCTGQRVPEDLHSAKGKHAWLVETAVKLRRESGRVADEHYLAENFGKVAAHA